MKKILNLLYSTRLMAVLFVVFAVAMGAATFIENDFGTQTSKALVYNTWWFELIMLFFVINFFGNIFKYKLYKKEKWSVLLFHLAFLFILIGAGITRYISFEGLMVIDEGETTNTFFSDTNYLNVIIDNNEFQKETNNKLLLSAWGKNTANFTEYFQPTKNEEAHKINFSLVDYIPWAEKKLVEDENGVAHLKFVESSSGSRHEHYIKKGTVQNIHNILVGFDTEEKNANINIFTQNDTLKILTKVSGTFQVMATQQKGNITKDSVQNFKLRSLYHISGLPFVVPQMPIKGEMKTLSGKKDPKKFDMVVFDVTTAGKTERIELTGGQFNVEGQKQFSIGSLNFRAWYGAKQRTTPFKVKLNDFQLEKYPGSENAASFASEVTVIAKEETFDFRLFMNHILNYKGYRLFQSGYKNAGEKIEQTHLSINHDFWGTTVSYIGYFLLFFGMVASLFVKNTRFSTLKNSLQKIRAKKTLVSLALLTSALSFSQHTTHQPKQLTAAQIDSVLQKSVISKKHADLFSELVIQDAGGRMKPAHTYASELVRKVAHTDSFNGLTPSQILVSITEAPMFWINVPFIYLEKGNMQIREILGLSKDTKYARLTDFYNANGTKSKINHLVIAAQKKRIQSKLEQDAIKIERRVWLLSQALSGSLLRIYPIPNNEENKWVSQPETSHANFKGTDSVFVRQSLPVYFQLLQNSKKSGNYTETNKVLEGIKKFQRKFGKQVIPSKDKVTLEIAYNKANIFVKLSKYYGYVSLLMILFVFLQIFKNKPWINYIVKALIAVVIVLFIAHITGLTMRWYISGNAPWSNAYESIIFVGLATMLFGLLLGRNSSLTIAATTFLTSTILFFAHQNWLDPEIANLVPVLNSWWLYVHVSIIVASYGPFSLGMILAIFAMFLIIFTNKKNKNKMNLHLRELTIINEMALTVGLVMLTVGNFLGGMWANESWGRYWGWDPKETWALISIMVYSFILHMRLIPGLKSKYAFNLAAIIGYASIMMTYFGVNFYLSGLHSYASGDKVITPSSVYYSIIFVTILGSIAWVKYKKFYKKQD